MGAVSKLCHANRPKERYRIGNADENMPLRTRFYLPVVFTVSSGILLANACGGDTSSSRPSRGGTTQGTGGAPAEAGPVVVDCSDTPIKFPEPAKLPEITELPDPFLLLDGSRMASPSQWPCRRAELAAYAQYYEYGFLPPRPTRVTGKLDVDRLAVTVEADGKKASFSATVALPASDGPFPVFIHISAGQPVASAATFTQRGYAFLFLDTGSVAADSTRKEGAFHTLYPEADTGVLMAWAWGVHRLVDALEKLDTFDSKRLIVNGFSRWGKGALLAGAFDERIAITVPSSSGLSGTGQFRFFYEDPTVSDTANEKIGNAWSNAAYWYGDRFGSFVSQVKRLPFDQHSIMALVAPRALLATQGIYDYWTNPRGTSISWRAAKSVFDYLGQSDQIGIAWDSVSHQLSSEHVDDILGFADLKFREIATTKDFHSMPADFADEPAAHPWTAP